MSSTVFSPDAARSEESSPHELRAIARDDHRDRVAVEEPLEIRVEGEPIVVTMCAPGHDAELAIGFLRGDGLIDSVVPVGLTEDLALNTIEIGGPLTRRPATRRFYTTFSCGVGAGEKDDPADVARDGFEALMEGDERAVSHLTKTKAQAAASRILPDSVKAEQHRKMAQPSSA
jgi:formate dehydrogenase assembly factor FdhD